MEEGAGTGRLGIRTAVAARTRTGRSAFASVGSQGTAGRLSPRLRLRAGLPGR